MVLVNIGEEDDVRNQQLETVGAGMRDAQEFLLFIRRFELVADHHVEGHHDVAQRGAELVAEVLQDLAAKLSPFPPAPTVCLFAPALLFGPDAAQNGLDAGDQLLGDEGLGDVIVRAAADSCHAVFMGGARGEKDKRDGARAKGRRTFAVSFRSR